jgi:hypothetical protein
LNGFGFRVFCAALALGLLAGALGSADDTKYKLEYKFYPGQRDRYVISADGKMTLSIKDKDPAEGTAKVKLDVTRYIRKVEGSGRIDYAVLLSAGQAEVMGSVRDFERQHGPLITIEPTGKVVKVDPEQSADLGFELTRLKEIVEYPVVMPSEPVKVGDTWESESPSGLKITNTLTKIEKVDDKDCAVIETKVSGALHDAPATVPAPEGPVSLDVSVANDMTGRYELETGRLVDAEGVVSIEGKGTQQDGDVPFGLKMTLNVDVKPPESNPLTPEAKPLAERQKPKQGPASQSVEEFKKRRGG